MQVEINVNVTSDRLGLGIEEPRKRILYGFGRWLGKIIKEQIKDAIETQKFKARWKALSEAYLEWKRRQGLDLRIWIATGQLLDSIDCYWSGSKGAWIVGINPYFRYPDGTKVLFVARWMEYGTDKMPARKVFSPVFNEVRRKFWRYLDEFVEEKGISKIN